MATDNIITDNVRTDNVLGDLWEFKLSYPGGWEEVWLARAGAEPISLVATAKQMLDLAGATYDIKWPISSTPASSSDEPPPEIREQGGPKPSRARGQTARSRSKSKTRKGSSSDRPAPSETAPGGPATEEAAVTPPEGS